MGTDPYWGYRLLCFYSESYSRSSEVAVRARRTTVHVTLQCFIYYDFSQTRSSGLSARWRKVGMNSIRQCIRKVHRGLDIILNSLYVFLPVSSIFLSSHSQFFLSLFLFQPFCSLEGFLNLPSCLNMKNVVVPISPKWSQSLLYCLMVQSKIDLWHQTGIGNKMVWTSFQWCTCTMIMMWTQWPWSAKSNISQRISTKQKTQQQIKTHNISENKSSKYKIRHLFVLLINCIRKKKGPRIVPWGTPLVFISL